MGLRRVTSITLAATASSLALASPSPAAPGGLAFDGCQTSSLNPPVPGCAPLEGLGATGALALGPDGRSAYASFKDGIAVFGRDRATGALSFTGCVDGTGAPPCAQVPGLGGTAHDLAVPPDGRSLYSIGGAFLSFQRDAASGGLTFASCIQSDYSEPYETTPGCSIGTFSVPVQLESSRDGRSVHVGDLACADNTGYCASGIVTYRRDPLTSVVSDPGHAGFGVPGVGPFAVGPRGTVYQVASDTGTIEAFRRKAGRLKWMQCIHRRTRSRYCSAGRKMARPVSVAVSPDGRRVVTGATRRGHALLNVLKRAKRGKLSFGSVVATPRRLRLRRIRQLDFSGSGRSLYAVAETASITLLVRFKLKPKRGGGAFAQCLAATRVPGCEHVPQLEGLSEIFTARGMLYASAGDAGDGWGADTLVRLRARPE